LRHLINCGVYKAFNIFSRSPKLEDSVETCLNRDKSQVLCHLGIREDGRVSLYCHIEHYISNDFLVEETIRLHESDCIWYLNWKNLEFSFLQIIT
jgi:hypothetical protein